VFVPAFVGQVELPQCHDFRLITGEEGAAANVLGFDAGAVAPSSSVDLFIGG